ncbi:TetR/AcrR family transcriptional regulator [Robertmurraya andreesenii]|uniref:AcrR family transcriptional regulator n=1 Tax=Anoxybacillus andreesenii TaxID=1325932 RepID=A0ABT9V0N2_9BACL|nr:TetR/AcrR family transcriptional regulator [Robertmurraya andreesenii]MDQ0154486.1 AcrR family transcriptional regulator [Robertmurraya andreesenii]
MTKSKLLEGLMQEMANSKKQTVKQQKIIQTAIELFAEKGYANTSTAEIAKQAEVAEGTIFKHYGTKDRLLLSIIVPYLKEIFPSMADEVIGEIMGRNIATFDEFLKGFFTNRIQFFNENKEIFQVLVKEFIYNQELRNELFPYFSENVLLRFGKIFDHFQERGELENIPRERVMKMLFTFIGGFFVSRFVILTDYTITEEEIDDAVRFVMNGLRG